MNRRFLLWTLAFVITAASAIYQRMTGPSYPATAKAELNGRTVAFSFPRSHGGDTDMPLRFATGDTTLDGVVEWKRHNTADAWTPEPMRNEGGVLTASLPHQPKAGKLDYFLRVNDVRNTVVVPQGDPIVVRFRGDVPTVVLIIHVIVIFAAMLFSTRTGLEVFSKSPRYDRLAFWTIILLFFGGLVLGPIVQKYSFDAFWTGWPFGHDLTDNKTLVAMLTWVVALIRLKKTNHPGRWILGAAFITLAVFLIPHSVLGSELDYSKVPATGGQ